MAVLGKRKKSERQKRLDKISELCEKDRNRVKYNLHESEMEKALNIYEDICRKHG